MESLSTEAHLEGAKLREAHLEGADLWMAHLEGAYLGEAHLEGADVRGADFSNAMVTGVTFDNKMTCMGARVSTCYGSIRFRRTVEDLGFIEEVKQWSRGAPKPTRELFKKKPFSALWTALVYPFRRSAARAWWLVDYGRSIWVLGFWFLIFACLAAWVFAANSGWIEWKDSFLARTHELTPAFSISIPVPISPSGHTVFVETPPLPQYPDSFGAGYRAGLYFSIVTLTTLGFGDIKAASDEGAIAVVCLVVLGYVMLGLLLSVLANKVARRA